MNTFAHTGFWPAVPLVWGLFWVGLIALAVWIRRRAGSEAGARKRHAG
ncbi:hypothetical protein [Nonomuraea sp. LPB2021202275-12-8]